MNLQPRVFCLWTDENKMSENRQNALSTIKNTGLEVIFINSKNLHSWIAKDMPLHPAYNYLSAVHKADYLRCYLMHHHGGAYSDIKQIEHSWVLPFERLKESHFFMNGYREVSFLETARGRGLIKDLWLAFNFYRMIGNCAYICKPNTPFTQEWLNSVHKVLNCKFETLKRHPAQDPRDFHKKRLLNNSVSLYPLRWTEICGEIFHPLCLVYSTMLLKSLPTPNFTLDYL